YTFYSGMLPGHVAGFYNYDETHIDLRRLAGFAQAQLYIDQAIGLDLENNKVICANHPPVAFDYLSIDIGSTPATISVPGATEYAIPAKPVPKFLQGWNQLLEEVKNNPQKSVTLGIVGGGAGGVELALNMQSNLHQLSNKSNLQIHLFHRANNILANHSQWASKRLKQILIKRDIELHLSENVTEILDHKIICESGLTVECSHIFWVTQASASNWIKASGIATDSKGFILVKDTLQSISHPHIFAAGDIATMENYSRPKAGVFAVRQGKPLFKNLRGIILGKPLINYIPQKHYLALIGTGDKNAIASWASFGWQSPLLWRWKDKIDRKFMCQFSNLPEMSQEKYSKKLPKKKSREIQNKLYCAGCGSKVGSSILETVLSKLQIKENQNIIIGLNAPDDAAVVQVPADRLMVHTVDYFRSLINDPFIFGQIATNHCLSDIYAMGATPQSALAVVTVPYGLENKVEETFYQLLSGATQVLQKAETPLIGGHTTEGSELAFGLACNGLVAPNKMLRKSGMKPDQLLMITKPLGTGTLFAADMRYKAKGRWIDNAIESMLISNQAAIKILLEYGTTACTDITGFGLLGHLIEMIKASGVAVELNLEAIPILTGAIETIEMGITSSLYPQNLQASSYINNLSEVSEFPKYPLLFDPQTAGGLLATIPEQTANYCLQFLKDLGHKDSCLIGRVMHKTTTNKLITINS
ncbi:MAG: selenide, water dikinase SelD, partial [Moorea sp. SIO2B7]|nr:selenide, water dikinase SelD [Moorena sp. SIO2B7]